MSFYKYTAASTIFISVFSILFLITLIYLYLKLKFFVFAIVDKSLNPLEGLTHSWQITKGNTFNLFLLLLTINITPGLAGTLITLGTIAQQISISTGQTLLTIHYIFYLFIATISVLADAYIYRQLSSNQEANKL